MDNAGFGQTTENVRKHRNTKLVTIERRRNYFESEPSHNTTRTFTETLLTIEMRKTQNTNE